MNITVRELKKGDCARSSVFLGSTLFLALALAGLTASGLAANLTAGALIKAGHWKRARPLAERQYQTDSNDAEAAYSLSRVRLAFGDLESAVTLAEKAVALGAKSSAYHYQLAVVCGRTAEKASLFSKGRWAKRFREEAETAASLDAKNLDARFGLLEFYLQAPRLMGGGKDKARAMAEEIGRIDAVSGYIAQARLAQDQKDWAGEQNAFAKAAAAGPKTYESHMSIVDFYLRPASAKSGQGGDPMAPANSAQIEKLAREAITLEPDRAEAYSALARLYALQKRWKELDALLADSTKKVPDNFVPFYHAGEILLEETPEGDKQLAKAEGQFRKYLSQQPEPDSPTLAVAHWKLGLVLEKEGRKKDAASEIQAALSVDPSLEKAKADLKRIQNGN